MYLISIIVSFAIYVTVNAEAPLLTYGVPNSEIPRFVIFPRFNQLREKYDLPNEHIKYVKIVKPSQVYGVPHVTYNVPKIVKPEITYGVPKFNKPSEAYNLPKIEVPSQVYGVPKIEKPSETYGVPNLPSQGYGVPKPAIHYGVPNVVPSQIYGVPKIEKPKTEKPQFNFPKINERYGVPKVYGLLPPATSYGVPEWPIRVVYPHTTYGLPNF